MKKILIVEDDFVSRSILSTAVQDEGYCAIQASDGTRAWGILNDNPDVEALITDMAMPSLDGRELITKLRNVPSLQHLPIVIVSGQVSLHEINDILKHGASRFLPKPINVMHLKQYLRALLSNGAEFQSTESIIPGSVSAPIPSP